MKFEQFVFMGLGLKYLGSLHELDTEAIQSTRCQRFRRGRVARIHDDVQGGHHLLDVADGTPQDALPSASIVGVRVEKRHHGLHAPPSPRCRLP